MSLHQDKFQPLAHFGKLAAAFLLLFPLAHGGEPSPSPLVGQATIQLKNNPSAQNLSGMDLILAPTSLIPEIRRIRMETWRTDGLAVQKNAEGGEQPVGLKIDFSDGYKNLDLQAMGQAAANSATVRTRTDTNGCFTFSNPTPGKQALYGQYKSRYAVAYWLLEVEIKSGQINRLTLSESNAAEVFNRFEKKSDARP